MDIFLANQWLIIGWLGFAIVLIGFHYLTKQLITQTALNDEKEVLDSHKLVFGWIWRIFVVVTFLGAISVGISQSINWMPRQTVDRSTTEQDQKNFERRIQERAK